MKSSNKPSQSVDYYFAILFLAKGPFPPSPPNSTVHKSGASVSQMPWNRYGVLPDGLAEALPDQASV